MMDRLANINKDKQKLYTLIGFCAVAIILIVIGTAVMKQPLVPICLAIIMEAAIAVCFHNMEIWIHGAVGIVQLIVGAAIGRFGIMVLCVVLYVAATVTLMMLTDEDKKKA